MIINTPHLDCFIYRGYSGSIEVDARSYMLHGKLMHISDLVTYEAETIPKLEIAFVMAVDDYLLDCEADGVDPNKPTLMQR